MVICRMRDKRGGDKRCAAISYVVRLVREQDPQQGAIGRERIEN